MKYNIFPIPENIRGSEYLNLLHKSIESESFNEATFRIKPFSWIEILGFRKRDERNIIHIHWETNIYGSKFIILSVIRMLYRFSALLLAKIRGVKIFWTIHNLFAHDYPHPKLDKLGRTIMWKIANGVQIQQEQYYIRARSMYSRPRIFFIRHPNFIDVFGPVWRGDKKDLRRHYGVPENNIVLLAFGSVRPYKEIPKLMEAVSQISDEGVPLTLVIAGKASSEYKDKIMALAKNKPSIVLKLGFVEIDEVPKLLAMSDYSILYYGESSLNSGPLLMSLSYGIPVISRKMPASEIISEGKNGFIFQNSDDLKNLLRKLKVNPVFDKNVIINSSGPSWAEAAVDLRKSYTDLWD